MNRLTKIVCGCVLAMSVGAALTPQAKAQVYLGGPAYGPPVCDPYSVYYDPYDCYGGLYGPYVGWGWGWGGYHGYRGGGFHGGGARGGGFHGGGFHGGGRGHR